MRDDHEVGDPKSDQLATARARIAAAYDPNKLAEVGKQVVGLIAAHQQKIQAGNGNVLNWKTPIELVDQARESLLHTPLAEGDLLEQVTNLVQKSLDRGTNLHHPRYVGHQVPASIPLASLFELVGSVTNQVMAIYEMGPWATAVEHSIIQLVGKQLGFNPGTFSGLITSGGSLANVTALLTARNIALDDVWSKGLASQTPPPVIVTHAESHYSVSRAAGMLGLGTDQIVHVGLDAQRRMDPRHLREGLNSLRRREVPVIAVSAAACATPIGAFDPLDAIAEICRQYGVWLHVDAAHGGATCFSDRHRHLIAGIEKADSVVCDAHKMMFMPALCAFVFYRNSEHRYATFEQIAPYLFDPSAPGMAEFDNGITNVECTKRAAAMGLWGIWSMFGKQLFAALVDITFDMAQVFFELLQEQSDFEVYCQPTCNIVAFRYLPTELNGRREDEMDAFQLKLRRLVIESGKFYLVQTSIDGRSYLRTTIINPLTSKKHLNSLIECLREQGQQLLQTTNSS
ncbi:MAG TPA: pyridoxal-dependent decarboxylase [Planctomycetaceae bacterium]|nr:pyridoxal-dependent decarboxylase [Planctomycetaceae bacterium]